MELAWAFPVLFAISIKLEEGRQLYFDLLGLWFRYGGQTPSHCGMVDPARTKFFRSVDGVQMLTF